MAGTAAASRNWPLISAVFTHEAEKRIFEEFLGYDPARLNRRAVHGQISEHLRTGRALREITGAFDNPGHWEAVVQRLAPDLLAEVAGVNVLVLDHDGRVRAHGDPERPRLVVARTSPETEEGRGWAGVMPDSSASQWQAEEPFGAIKIDDHGRMAQYAAAGEEARLGDAQQQAAGTAGLRVEPTQVGPDSFYSAVLAAAGGGLLLDRGTYVGTPEGLRQNLADLVRERPDVLDVTNWRQIRDITDDDELDVERITNVLSDSASPEASQLIPYLAGPYLGVELSVIQPDGNTSIHGTGQAITIAPTTGQDGLTHWAALVPARENPFQETGLAGLPVLPDLPGLPDFNEVVGTGRWDPDYYKLIRPETSQPEEPWRNSTFCLPDGDGNLACVSVTVITVQPSADSMVI